MYATDDPVCGYVHRELTDILKKELEQNKRFHEYITTDNLAFAIKANGASIIRYHIATDITRGLLISYSTATAEQYRDQMDTIAKTCRHLIVEENRRLEYSSWTSATTQARWSGLKLVLDILEKYNY